MMTDAAAADGQLSTRRYWALLLGIVAIGTLVRLFHHPLSIGSDDQVYIIVSRALGEPYRPEILPVFYSRIVWRCLLAGWGALFGLTLETSAVLMFLLGACTILLVAASARLVFGPVAGVFGALIYATLPLAVTYDTDLYPDGLGAALIAACLFLFLKYLRGGGGAWLWGVGFLAGLSYSVKDYYILAVAPIGVCLLCQKVPWSTRLRQALACGVWFFLGISADLALHYWESGNPLAHVAAVADYGQRQAEWAPAGRLNIYFLHSLFWHRSEYVRWLLVDGGIVNGFVLLMAILVLAWQARARLECRALLGTAALFFVFLYAMPASVNPLVLVEMQPRYLLVVLPPLAIGGGGALAAVVAGLERGAARNVFLSALMFGFAYNVCVPNDQLNRDMVQPFAGVRHVLEKSRRNGIGELVLPAEYALWMPDSYYTYGVGFCFKPLECSEAVRQTATYLENRPGCAVFIPERPYPPNEHYSELKTLLEAKGFATTEVRVPETSYRSWLRWLDFIDARDVLVGRVCRPAPQTAEPARGESEKTSGEGAGTRDDTTCRRALAGQSE